MELLSLLGGYVTSFLGFSLGKSTLEEHNEIKIKALFFSYMFQFLAILGLFYIYSTLSIILGTVFLLILLIGYFKNHYILEFNTLLLYITTFYLYFSTDYFFITILPIISLIIENSFKKFNRREEIYKFVIIVILGLLII
jgi:hypothetical protein